MAATLELEGVGVVRDGKVLLAGVDLTVAPRSIHVVVGENGAGKSTLVGAILGRTPFTGAIRLHWRASRRLGHVPQLFEVDRTLPVTVAEFLALERQRRPVCLGVGRAARARIDALLERVGLAGLGRRRLGELSGGELRRVLFANAIDPAPELLVCDEAASGLDPAAVSLIDDLLLELRDRHGTAALLVSHNLDEVRRVADRVTRLAGGTARSGTAAELLG